ncbi:MAG TPA: ThuA domain-containing protein, partial [Opitutus sp.]|nr:ThuA domain-containing protein [Opitutus sp.]
MKLPQLFVLLVALVCPALESAAAVKKIVFIAGKPSHGPLQHEHRAGSLLLQKCLADFPGIITQVYDNGWPTITKNGQTVDNNAAFEGADAIIIYSDGGGGHPTLQGERLQLLERLTKSGVGLGLIHYAVEPTLAKGQKEFLDWVGGAFEINLSVNPHWTADFKTLPVHAVTRGVNPFSSNDEWYFNLRFRDGMRGVTPILTAVPPASTMSRPDGAHSGNPAAREAVAKGTPQTVMWVSERNDGGRGFGFTGGHYHMGWKNDDQRRVVLNAILWLANIDVPAGGVVSKVTDQDMNANLDAKTAKGPIVASTEPAPEIVPPEILAVPEGFEVTVWARSPLLN